MAVENITDTLGLLSASLTSLAAFSSSVADSFSGFTKLAGSLTETMMRKLSFFRRGFESITQTKTIPFVPV